MEQNNQIVIYQTPDGQTSIDVKLEKETVWLTSVHPGGAGGGQRGSGAAAQRPGPTLWLRPQPDQFRSAGGNRVR